GSNAIDRDTPPGPGRSLDAGADARLAMGGDVLQQRLVLAEETVLLGLVGGLEEARQVAQVAALVGAVGEVGHPDQVQDQRRRERRVAALPDELEDHLGAEEAGEVDEVPGGLPVAERRDIVDPDAGMGLVVAQDVAEAVVLVLALRL